ncbi:MAG: class I SAM-dependent methyltransferase [Pseudomonadota bacterium]
MGLETVLGLRRRGFFLPYRYAASVEPPANYPALETVFREAEADFETLLGHIQGLEPAIDRLSSDHGACRFDQQWFPRLDALAAYAMVRFRKPSLIVEIGSGHSTRFMARAIADGALSTAFTCIDPEPRASLAGLNVTWQRMVLQTVPFKDLKVLQSGDVLFVDSSHLLMPGTDVDHLISQILPSLPNGVLLHIHDIFLPDGYPKSWAWRGYNEQSAVAALLQGGGYQLLFSSRYVATRMKDRLAKSPPFLQKARVTSDHDDLASSLWLQKVV